MDLCPPGERDSSRPVYISEFGLHSESLYSVIAVLFLNTVR